MGELTIFDAVLFALAVQQAHPDRNGGGMIGRAQAVVLALGIDGDEPVSSIRPLATEGPTTEGANDA